MNTLLTDSEKTSDGPGDWRRGLLLMVVLWHDAGVEHQGHGLGQLQTRMRARRRRSWTDRADGHAKGVVLGLVDRGRVQEGCQA